MDLRKYLVMKAQIEADIEMAKKEVEDAINSVVLAQTAHRQSIDTLHNLESVKKMLDDLEANEPTRH